MTLRLRPAARAVLLDPDDRALLVRFEFPDRVVWATPGGGIEHGESDELALRRELAEEAGLEDFELGPLVWTRTHVVPLSGGKWDGQQERYYLVRVPAFEPAPRLTWEELRSEGCHRGSLVDARASWRRRTPSSRPAASLLSSAGCSCTGRPPSPIDVGV